jgi:tetratricopeptide (TPR) repeat protein
MLKLRTQLSWVKIRTGQWEAAEDLARDCYEDALKWGDLEIIHIMLNILGTIAHHRGQFKDAIAYRTQALDYSVRLNDQRGWCNTMMQIATCYDTQGDFSAAENAYLQALTTARHIGFHRIVSGILINLGYSAYLQGRFADAVHYLEEGLEGVRALKAGYFVCVALANIIPSYLPLENYTKALQALQEGLMLAIDLGAEYLKVTMLVAAVQTWVASARVDSDATRQRTMMSSAARWAGLIQVHPAGEQENRDEIDKLLPSMKALLGVAEVDDLLQQGSQFNLDEVIAAVLKELEAFV